MMNADGSGQRLLTGDTPGVNSLPSVSPDGRYVFFDYLPASSESLGRMNIDGGVPTPMAKAPMPTVPRCSPDGKWVFYHLFGDSASPTWMMSPDGSTKRPWKGKVDGLLAVSPDGTRLAGFYADPASSRTVLTITPVQGGEPDKVFSLPDGARQTAWEQGTLRWTPDGRAVAYVVGSDRVANIWVQPVDGGASRPLTDFKDGGGIWSFDWSKDGRFAMARGPVNKDVVMMSREKR
jgi:Tol biopolymer transport system component